MAKYVILPDDYLYDGKGTIESIISNTHAISNEILINGEPIYIGASQKVDVTKYLHKGHNRLIVRMYTGLRNTFGPFHHKYGKHYYTGPSVFEGYAEWQDFVIYPELHGNTYIDEYSFVHLYIPKLTIINKGEK